MAPAPAPALAAIRDLLTSFSPAADFLALSSGLWRRPHQGMGHRSGDILPLDIAAGQWKWRVSDFHPGGVTAVAYLKNVRTVYTTGTDGMVCKIDVSDGSVVEKFGHRRKQYLR
ncbi:hypothetical protein GUJ93_ZPchr0013g37641 [Zizania palustris]|uniref:Uncharacterized protein n=1 Tax=Zizania palustris TaxID=103762 RepID=A0A8J6BV47_ZIZPA|nr:hypothetical protein GUJ93_ZPchr0013g37641 [Zizania palustris]KAG8096330.1 hypothetical protein GUJ93_ZPchr0013g37641 [Zizania palustris]